MHLTKSHPLTPRDLRRRATGLQAGRGGERQPADYGVLRGGQGDLVPVLPDIPGGTDRAARLAPRRCFSDGLLYGHHRGADGHAPAEPQPGSDPDRYRVDDDDLSRGHELQHLLGSCSMGKPSQPNSKQ